MTEQKLTNLQLEILKLFRYNLSDNQLLELKGILVRYFANSATNEMDKLWDERGWDNTTMDQWVNADLKSKHIE